MDKVGQLVWKAIIEVCCMLVNLKRDGLKCDHCEIPIKLFKQMVLLSISQILWNPVPYVHVKLVLSLFLCFDTFPS